MELLADDPGAAPRLRKMQPEGLIDQVLSYIDAHCTEKLTCEQVAGAFSYHPNSLNRIIREKQGCSLHDLITSAKINVAIRLLTETDMSITDIAYYLGFYDRAHFAKTFCKVAGQSPHNYRIAHQSHQKPNHKE